MIADFFRERESKTLEFKENTKGLLGILKTVVAFANTSGGIIVVGVKDKSKEVLGLENPLLEEENNKTCQTLGIYTDHFGKQVPTVGGILLFGKDRQENLPDAIIRLACFQGNTKEKIIDSIEITSALPFAVTEGVQFIERHVSIEAKIGKVFRKDISQYPPFAIREALINAIVHTDYAMKGCHIQVAIFSDRIEITNPGGLPFGQTLKKALSGYSRLRNRVIGRVFRELKLIEQWESGLQRIIETCKKMGLQTSVGK